MNTFAAWVLYVVAASDAIRVVWAIDTPGAECASAFGRGSVRLLRASLAAVFAYAGWRLQHLA